MTEDQARNLFQEALALRNAGEFRAAAERLASLEPFLGDRAHFWLLHGDLQDELEGIDFAIASYKRAVQIAPTDELASRSLFHALWSLGLEGDHEAEGQAIAEVRRFTGLAQSDWYDKIVHELHAKRHIIWPDSE